MSELLPPEPSTVLAKEPEIKLWHLPLVMVWLGGIVGVLGVFITVAVLAGAIVAIAVFVTVAALLLVCFPLFFWTEYRKRHAEFPHR